MASPPLRTVDDKFVCEIRTNRFSAIQIVCHAKTDQAVDNWSINTLEVIKKWYLCYMVPHIWLIYLKKKAVKKSRTKTFQTFDWK